MFLSDKCGMIAKLQGLDSKDGLAMKDCYKKFVDLVVIYHETTRAPWFEKPMEIGEASKTCLATDLQNQRMYDGATHTRQDHFGVKLEGKDEEKDEQHSSQESNDFDIIV